MNILMKELYYNRKSLIVWTAIIVLLSVYMMAMYPSIQAQAATMDEFMKAMPKELLRAFNMDQLGMSDPLEYFGGKALFMTLLAGAVYAALIGSSVFGKEEDERTIEFLLSRPISRNEIIINKMLYTFIYILVFNLITALCTLAAAALFVDSDFHMARFFMLTAGMFLVQLALAGVGHLFGQLRNTSKGLVIGFVFLQYFLSTLSTLTEKSEFLGYVSVFKYFDTIKIIKEGIFGVGNVLVLIAVYVISVVLTFIIYNKKNITA